MNVDVDTTIDGSASLEIDLCPKNWVRFRLGVAIEVLLMTNRNTFLKELISNLRKAIANGEADKEMVETSINALANRYDDDLYPDLTNTIEFDGIRNNAPSNLAEALLWKMGKWKSYKEFADDYKICPPEPKDKGSVVFFAFARHLRKPDENPIFDQHVMRAMWAICPNFTKQEECACKAWLVSGRREELGWKRYGSGSTANECLDAYRRHLKEIEEGGATKKQIDHLLMPLGKAIKESMTYEEFRRIREEEFDQKR